MISATMNFKNFVVIWTIFFVAFRSCSARRAKIHRLEKLNVNPNLVTISGFSSGAAQAMQFHIAHSSKLLGVGIFSGVPYMYGHDRSREDFFVTDPGNFNISLATDFAKNYEKEHLIDPLHHLNNSRVYIYHGTKDSTVYHGCGRAIETIYSNLSRSIISKLDALPAEHGMASDNSGGPCGMVNVGQYLVNNCKYSGVYEMFNHLYGEDALVKPNGTMGTVPLRGRFYEFDQSEFFDKKGFFSKSAGMDDVGFAYIPSRCSVPEKDVIDDNSTAIYKPYCKLAIALHGCTQTRQTYGDKFPRTTGYLEVAELNDIIVIFPQTKRSVYNPRNLSGCWDWMGFTGKQYGTQNGLQIKVIRKILSRALGEDTL